MSHPDSSDATSITPSPYKTENLLNTMRRATVPNIELIRLLEAVHDELLDVNARVLELQEIAEIQQEALDIMLGEDYD